MVTDDEEFCIAAMKAMLNTIGIDTQFHVDFCINGQEAVNKLTNTYSNGMRYKLIFTDFKMPIMDGIEATRQIRQILASDYQIEAS